MRDDLHLTDVQYAESLQRFRDAIANGAILKFFDCTDIGNKDTQCSWGLCSRKKAMWPDKATHKWPDDPRDEGKDDIYGIKYLENHQLCPMDKREQYDGRGCFYSCRVFQGPRPSREEALRLYDLAIDRLAKAEAVDDSR